MREKVAKVSMIFTAYNAEPYIAASVSAALSQDYSDFEVVVLDDGSTDSTEGVCRSISDPRLRFLKRGRKGRSAAVNEAISSATGEFIAINGGNDLSFPFRLSYVMGSFASKPSVLLVGTNWASTNEFLRDLPACYQCENGSCERLLTILSKEHLYRGMPFTDASTVFRKDVWRKAGGYNESLDICVDYDFVLRVARLGDIGYLPGKTVLIFINPNSYFGSKKTSVYLRTLFAIKKQFRRDFRIPLRARVQDLRYLREFFK